MKVALLSFHNAYNFGAALQAYALQDAVEKCEVEAEYINYVNVSRRQAYDMIVQIKLEMKNKNIGRMLRCICGIPFMAQRKRKFESFYSKFLRKTEEVYTTSKEASVLNDKYDKFVVGSDQVWNPGHNGNDPAFLLDFVEDNLKKIAYSSSFGISSLSEEQKFIYRENLSSFERLSTREAIGVDIIKDICNRNAHLVLDPVFLVTKESWEGLAKAKKNKKEKYIFFYTNRKSQINDFLSTGYKTDDFKFHILSSHVSPRDFIRKKNEIKFSMSPEEFVAEILNAELVVSASFHCLAMAIILQKPFVAILTGDSGKDERVINLLNIAGLRYRVLSHGMNQEEIDQPIDYEKVDSRMRKYIDSSKQYLYNAIYGLEDIGFECNNVPTTDKRNIEREARFCIDARCTGCGVCSEVCPYGAITMQSNEEGFLVPLVDEKVCVHCGLCHSACQVFIRTQKSSFKQQYYGVKNLDEIRVKSSSGGVFSALAEYVLDCGGVIFAAQMDEQFVVFHKMATSADEVHSMKNTFYVQSDLRHIFTAIYTRLREKKQVLFVGTPCQVEGLKLYLDKEYDNLITIDLVCHGVSSPGVFKEFINFLKTRGELREFNFRDKTCGWSGYQVSAVIDGKKHVNNAWLKSFNCMFSHNLINRKSCSMCRYANYDRPGDITIGDFWGIDKVDSQFSDKLGISLVMVNTQKGQYVFENLKNLEVKKYEKQDTGQNSLIHPATMNKNRIRAFSLLNEKNYKAVAKKYGEYNVCGVIKDYIRRLL